MEQGQTLPSAKSGEGGKFRISAYVTEQELTSLDEISAHLRRQEKRLVDRSQIIREAIRRYHEALLAR